MGIEFVKIHAIAWNRTIFLMNILEPKVYHAMVNSCYLNMYHIIQRIAVLSIMSYIPTSYLIALEDWVISNRIM